MAVVITVAQQKGGTGKTTLAAKLAAALAPAQRVALLDIDPQRSLARWHALRAGLGAGAGAAVSDVSGWRLAAELDRLRRSHDVVMIDSPPQIDTDAKLAVRGADLVLVPLQPSPPDLWAAEGTLKLAAAKSNVRRGWCSTACRASRQTAPSRWRRHRAARPAGCWQPRSATAPGSRPRSRRGWASPRPRRNRSRRRNCWRCWRKSQGIVR